MMRGLMMLCLLAACAPSETPDSTDASCPVTYEQTEQCSRWCHTKAAGTPVCGMRWSTCECVTCETTSDEVRECASRNGTYSAEDCSCHVVERQQYILDGGAVDAAG